VKQLVGRNMPEAETLRSPTAQTIGELARSSGLFLSHFEHRHHLELPGHWVPEGRPDLSGEAHWKGGHLVEHKYRHFSYDNPIGSFHPAHRAKWTTHELCHGLVGFAWQPGATPFFSAMTAWLSELLPVALWYFFDEHGLRRCPDHDGPLFGHYCHRCEEAALLGAMEPENDEWLVKGRAFVQDQLASIARSRRTGRIHSRRFASIDLANDALTWVAAHRGRLESPEYQDFRSRFLEPTQGAFNHLDDLEGRVVELMGALTGDGSARPWEADSNLWVAQDIAWRLTTVRAQSDTEVANAIGAMVDALAHDPSLIAETIEGYKALHQDWIIPEPTDVFAVGYPLLQGYGSAVTQLAEGIVSSCEVTAEFLGEDLIPVIDAFSQNDPPVRQPIGLRFAQYLREEADGPLADLARYESAVAHASTPDPELDALGQFVPLADADYVPTEGIAVLSLTYDIQPLLNDAAEDLDAVVHRPHFVALRRTAGGDIVVAEVSEAAAQCLQYHGHMPCDELPEAEQASLIKLGLLRPRAWSTHA